MEQIGIRESALLGPGEEIFITFPGITTNGTNTALGSNVMNALNSYQLILYLIGKVSYHDVFPGSTERHTKFCAFYVPATNEVGSCPVNRTMD